MIILNDVSAKAVAKLEQERKSIPVIKDNEIGAKLQGKGAADAKASLMADAVLKVLADFCQQSSDFAKAVLSGSSFGDCIKSVAKGIGNYAEGAEVCEKCVQFYIPGAKIHMQWRVELPKSEDTGRNGNQNTEFTLELMDLLN